MTRREHVALLLLALTARAQQTTVSCTGDLAWTWNDRNQSPCLVGAYLLGSCLSDPTSVNITSDVVAWRPGYGYTVNLCSCSTVTYALMSACAICAGTDQIMQWTTWRDVCPQEMISLMSIPFDVPSGTALPLWSLQNVERSNYFDPEVASNVAAANEPDVEGTTSSDQPSAQPASSSTQDSTTKTSGSRSRSETVAEPVLESSTTTVVSTRTKSHVPVTAATAETTAPPHEKQSPAPVVAGVIGALVAVCVVASSIACIIRRKGYLRPRARRKLPVAALSLVMSEKTDSSSPSSTASAGASHKKVETSLA
ncbi:hypothetical protein BKA62DRAFT_364787 [Auriculariales sp. MPI-PUGE-AT-0066]|nr:hypothetical protein BKA62DRAFT_364787 [Auriculariales sp. MPI-PUGE-AT-0066]